MESASILTDTLESLALSHELKALLVSKNYTCLNDVLQHPVAYLRSADGLNFHQELELFNLVSANRLEHLWKEG